MARPRSSKTPVQVLDVAERLIQTRGFNGFSYADVAAEVGITKASLHYHFPSKADLGLSLVHRYQETFEEALAELTRGAGETRTLLEGYAELYRSVLRKDRMCLCGMLAAEHTTLPAPMQRALQAFFDANERWLTGVLEAGRRRGELELTGGAREEARLLVAGLEGALLVARSYDDPRRFHDAAARLIDGVLGGSARTGSRRRAATGRRAGSTVRTVRPIRASAPR
jgi:TetR/AcrR family transcriptional regulator, transcriptional repressor for nem operon